MYAIRSYYDEDSQLNISPLTDSSDVQIIPIKTTIDMSRPGISWSNIASGGGRVVIGGFPNLGAPEENALIVITP